MPIPKCDTSKPVFVQLIHIESDSLEGMSMQRNVSEDEINDSESEYKPHNSAKKATPWQMRIKLQATALHSDRYGVSERATAAIASSVLEDIGIITERDSSQVIDRYKICREKSCNRTELQNKSQKAIEQLNSLYFDGRKDNTLVIEKRWNQKSLEGQ